MAATADVAQVPIHPDIGNHDGHEATFLPISLYCAPRHDRNSEPRLYRPLHGFDVAELHDHVERRAPLPGTKIMIAHSDGDVADELAREYRARGVMASAPEIGTAVELLPA